MIRWVPRWGPAETSDGRLEHNRPFSFVGVEGIEPPTYSV
jgi:hypothetical protein